MKRTEHFLYLLLLFSCNAGFEQKKFDSDSLLGDWKLVSTSYTMDSGSILENNVIEFTDSSRVIYKTPNGQKLPTGYLQYELKNDAVFLSKQEVILDGVEYEKDSFRVTIVYDDTLILKRLSDPNHFLKFKRQKSKGF